MTLPERSRSEASLLADRPAARNAASGVAASASGVNGSPTVVRSLPWIAVLPPGADERAEGAVRVAWAMSDRPDAGNKPGEYGIAYGNLAGGRLERGTRHG